MPTRRPTEALSLEQASHRFQTAATDRDDRAGLGLEVEVFAFGSEPPDRVPIGSETGTLALLRSDPDGLGPPPGACPDARGWALAGGADGALTFEPGGQLEVATAYAPRPADAVATADRLLATLARTFARRDLRAVAAGSDLWCPGRAAQQRTDPRYPAMEASFAARGPSGRRMMLDTCALQLNLDLATGSEAEARWIVTNLLAPLATATFACSPTPDGRGRSARSLLWQSLDPTRTGFVDATVRRGRDLATAVERFAMDADVLLIVDGASGEAVAPGFRFRDWVAHGHPGWGWPTDDDLARHLTTLFPEVRPRGHLEIRSLDAVPARFRHAATTLYLGAVYEPTARDRILEVLLDRAPTLRGQLRAAARTGLRDAAACARAVEVWSYALEGAARLPTGWIASSDLDTTERFLDRFTLRGRCPADDLADQFREHGPLAALDWATEPTETRTAIQELAP